MRGERREGRIGGKDFKIAQRVIIGRLEASSKPVGSVELMNIVSGVLERSKRISYGHLQSLVNRMRRQGVDIKGVTGTGGGYTYRPNQLRLGGPFENV